MMKVFAWLGWLLDAESVRPSRGGLAPVEVLEGRHLLSSMYAGMTMVPQRHIGEMAPMAFRDRGENLAHRNDGDGHDRMPHGPIQQIHNGEVVKKPAFYELYLQSLPPGTAPRQDLNVREASARLDACRGLVLTGTMNAPIDRTKDSIFVWGFDRNGHLGLDHAPFPNRPNIRFDAVVVVTLKADGTVTGSVIDLTGVTPPTTLPTDAIRVDGKHIEVTVANPAAALPSTGLPLDQYRFNLWPRVGLGPPSTVVSFAPGDAMARIGHSDDRGSHH